MPIPAEFEAHLKRVDPDRWLAARFVSDRSRRDELLALYALNDELARVGESVREPIIGEMRFAWWEEALQAAAAGRRGRGHPVLEALAAPLAEGRLPLAPLERMIAARRASDLERAPFADGSAVDAYLEATAGALMSASAVLLDSTARDLDLGGAGRAWGWAGLLRATPAWEARGRRWAPADWAEAGSKTEVRARVEAALASPPAAALPVAAFPAVAYATLARPYARGRRPGELEKRARLLAAVARGRL